MKFQLNDGGRAAAGYQGEAGDCVTRAIAIATGKPYAEVYDALSAGIRELAKGRSRAAKQAARGGGCRGTTPRNGVARPVYDRYLKSLGWDWVATTGIGTGCKVHLKAEELPAGRIIVRLSKHIATVIDGTIHDTYDPSRGETRCVYGYYRRPEQVKKFYRVKWTEQYCQVREAATADAAMEERDDKDSFVECSEVDAVEVKPCPECQGIDMCNACNNSGYLEVA